MLDILSPKRKRKVEPVVKISLQKMIEKEPTEGIYTDGSGEHFKSVKDIERETLEKARIQIEEGSMPTTMSFEDFHEEALRRSEFRENSSSARRLWRRV